MSDRSHTAAQRDFSAGEVDVTLKRSEDHPIFKSSLRQCQNFRILDTKKLANRFGRTALFVDNQRVDEVLMSPGNIFYLIFGNGSLKVRNAAGAVVFSSTLKGDGVTPISWTTATVKNIVWDVSGLSIYIAYADGVPANVPQILTWDGVSQTSTWTLSTFAPDIIGNAIKHTLFSRLSPRGITMALSGSSGSVTATFSGNVLTAGSVGTFFRYGFSGQLLCTAVTNPTTGTMTVNSGVLGVRVTFTTSPVGAFNVGDVVTGATSGFKGVVSGFAGGGNTADFAYLILQGPTNEQFVGPNGALTVSSSTPINPPPITIWDEEVMNTTLRGWPSSLFVDQSRLGFCNFPSVPQGIAYSGIGNFGDFFLPLTGLTPQNAIFEFAPRKSQVLYIVPGMEGSEFIFCDNGVYYAPITAAQPLSATVGLAFNLLTRDGSANVQPVMVQEAVVYVSAGSSTMRAVAATGAYLRPYEVRALSRLHDHLFKSPIAIAAPSATDPNFPERYIYVLNSDGTFAVGKINIQDGRLLEDPGWVSMSGAGTVVWVAARGGDVIFTTTYQPTVTIAERNDATQYLDAALAYNNVPAALVAPPGKGPLWWLAGGTVTVMDLGTRQLGTYTVDVNGFLVPQFQGGENLASTQLVVGQAWTATLEPWMAGPEPGADFDQRFTERAVQRIGVYYQNSTGFVFQKLFSKKQGPKQPALGTVVRTERVPTYNQDDDPTQPPILREGFDYWRPIGREYDPRIAIVKDTSGPLTILEIGSEVTV